jgi:flavin reductase (DIM6/NTAB) family NADH-FMN oxidoreductase RutF
MRKFWNIPAAPVYALLTRNASGHWNYNCCTYVSAVGMHPKHYMVAVYQGTKSLENLRDHPDQSTVLHLLSPAQASLIRILGRQSGHAVDKYAKLLRGGHLDSWRTYPVLKEAAAWAELRSLGPCKAQSAWAANASGATDHELWLWELVSARVNSIEYLDTATMRRLGILR